MNKSSLREVLRARDSSFVQNGSFRIWWRHRSFRIWWRHRSFRIWWRHGSFRIRWRHGVLETQVLVVCYLHHAANVLSPPYRLSYRHKKTRVVSTQKNTCRIDTKKHVSTRAVYTRVAYAADDSSPLANSSARGCRRACCCRPIPRGRPSARRAAPCRA